MNFQMHNLDNNSMILERGGAVTNGVTVQWRSVPLTPATYECRAHASSGFIRTGFLC